MQRAGMAERRNRGGCAQRDTEILHFSLQEALPLGHNLAFNSKLGTISYLVYENGRLSLAVQEHFTNTEMSVLLPLLEMFPYYCPYEALYAGFYRGRMTDEAVEEGRNRLDSALERGTWDQEMRPIRDALSRARIKLKRFGIEVLSILVTGYILNVPSLPKSKPAPQEALGDLVRA